MPHKLEQHGKDRGGCRVRSGSLIAAQNAAAVRPLSRLRAQESHGCRNQDTNKPSSCYWSKDYQDPKYCECAGEGANAKHISSTSGSPLRKNVKIQNGRPSGTSGGTQVLIATAIRAAAPNATAARYIIGQPPWRAVDTIKCAAFRWRTIPSEWCGWFLRPGACGAGWRRRRQTASRGRYCSCRR